MSGAASPTDRRLGRRLLLLNLGAAAAMALHDADHFRQAAEVGHDVPPHVATLLLLAYIPLALSAWWAFRGRVRAACIATLGVVGGVLGLLGSAHLVGLNNVSTSVGTIFDMWGDSYVEMDVDGLSWAALGLLAVAYLWVLRETLTVLRAAR